jgi:hypothetical protein
MVEDSRLVQSQDTERSRVLAQTEADRYWWKKKDTYMTDVRVADGFKKGELVTVPPMGNGWKLIQRLNDPIDGEPNWLRVTTLRYMESVFNKWSVLLPEVSDSIKLSVTSLGRTEKVQKELLRGSGKYRVAENGKSSHLAGAAFDVSLRSYYKLDEDSGEWKSVAVWNTKESDFNQVLIEALVDVLELDEKWRLCKLTVEPFIESDGSAMPSVAHVCVSPRLNELGSSFGKK